MLRLLWNACLLDAILFLSESFGGASTWTIKHGYHHYLTSTIQSTTLITQLPVITLVIYTLTVKMWSDNRSPEFSCMIVSKFKIQSILFLCKTFPKFNLTFGGVEPINLQSSENLSFRGFSIFIAITARILLGLIGSFRCYGSLQVYKVYEPF